MAEHLSVGQKGEEAAARYLEQAGFRILARNVSNEKGIRLGEIDIVAEKKREIIFVEVKTLSWYPEGDEWRPEWHVTPAKLHKLERIAHYYLRHQGLENREYHHDVVAVLLNQRGETEIRHIEHAFF